LATSRSSSVDYHSCPKGRDKISPREKKFWRRDRRHRKISCKLEYLRFITVFKRNKKGKRKKDLKEEVKKKREPLRSPFWERSILVAYIVKNELRFKKKDARKDR